MAFVGTTIPVPSGANLEAFFSMMTNGASVRLQLERGGTYPGDIRYSQAGGGPDNLHIITAAPVVAGGPTALPVLTGTWQIGIEATPISGLTVKNLAFTSRGPNVLGSGENLTLKGLVVTGATQGITVQAEGSLRWSDVVISHCRVMDITAADHAQGMYLYAIDGLRIVDCVVDHAISPIDILSHNIYVQNGNTGVVVRRNILTRASSHALQLRPGGEASNNLIIDCPIGILCGGGTAPETGGVVSNVHDNVVIGGGNIGTEPRGWAYYMENIGSGSLHNNIALDGVGGDKRGLTKDCSETVLGNPEVGVLGLQGANYHKNHPTVHTDAGPSTGTTVSWNGVPITNTDVSMAGLGLTYDAIRAGTVSPVAVIQMVKELVGLSTPKAGSQAEYYVKRALGNR